jgi:hypothetical protein
MLFRRNILPASQDHREQHESACCVLDLFFHPEVVGFTFLRNEGKYLPDYVASYPGKILLYKFTGVPPKQNLIFKDS